MAGACPHLESIRFTTTDKRYCEDCVKKHFHSTAHPLVRSIEPGESWVWCYVDEVMPGELPA